MKKIILKNIETVKETLKKLDSSVCDELTNDCCNALQNGNKIILSGLGKNVPICEKAVGMMTSLSIDSRFLNTNSALHGDLGMICENDIIILLSKSGATTETLKLLEQLKYKKCCIWLMTCGNESEDFNIKTFLIPLVDEGDLWNIVPNNSSTIFLIILQALCLKIASRLKISIERFRENHPGGEIGKKLNEKTNSK